MSNGPNGNDIRNLTRALYEMARQMENLRKILAVHNENMVAIYKENQKKED